MLGGRFDFGQTIGVRPIPLANSFVASGAPANIVFSWSGLQESVTSKLRRRVPFDVRLFRDRNVEIDGLLLNGVQRCERRLLLAVHKNDAGWISDRNIVTSESQFSARFVDGKGRYVVGSLVT